MEEKKTLADRIEEYGPAARPHIAADFAKAGVAYPPTQLVLVGLKTERVLEVYASSGGDLRHVKTYPILGASGNLGPKLKEGDKQVPEGIYKIELLNPNSVYQISMRIGYPNDFDKKNARDEGRENLGGDIMIHGGSSSAGCLAMGDPASEELFILAADTGIENIKVILSPVDFRVSTFEIEGLKLPSWTGELYNEIAKELGRLPASE